MSKIKCGSRSAGKNEDEFDPHWLDIGEQIEYEHTCDKKEARRIAMDHLSEFEDYYKELQKMEKKLESKSKPTPPKPHPTQKNICKTQKLPLKNIVNKKTDDVERNMEDLVDATKSSKKKIINNITHNFKYIKVKQ